MNTVSNMDKVLRSVYLDAITNNINQNSGLFYKRIEKSNVNVMGKEVAVPCTFELNGGVSSPVETGNLPNASSPKIELLKAPLINIYGHIELSDKLIKISNAGIGEAVNMINNEMESLLFAAKFNLRRMLFQNGNGLLAKTTAQSTSGTYTFHVTSTRNFRVGMLVDIMVPSGTGSACSIANKVVAINPAAKTVTFERVVNPSVAVSGLMAINASYKNELYGIPYLFDDTLTDFYGNVRSEMSFALPQQKELTALNLDTLQSMVDAIEEYGHDMPDIVLCDFAFRRKYITYLRNNGLNVDYAEIDNGYKAPVFSGIPICAEQFMEENTAYVLNTEDFVLGQLNDWSWIEDANHGILNPLSGKAAFGATLVKYCNLICKRPAAQLKVVLNENE